MLQNMIPAEESNKIDADNFIFFLSMLKHKKIIIIDHSGKINTGKISNKKKEGITLNKRTEKLLR